MSKLLLLFPFSAVIGTVYFSFSHGPILIKKYTSKTDNTAFKFILAVLIILAILTLLFALAYFTANLMITASINT